MKNFLKKAICFSFISFYVLKVDQIQSLVPYYYLPTKNNLQKESLSIGKNAYQLLYFGQYQESINLAKLAIKINKTDEKLWLILAEAQIANKLDKKALEWQVQRGSRSGRVARQFIISLLNSHT